MEAKIEISMDLNMKPSLAADEMFSEGPGYMEMDEVSPQHSFPSKNMVVENFVYPCSQHCN